MSSEAEGGSERRSIIERLGGGQGIAAIITAIAALTGLFLTQCGKADEPPEASEVDNNAPGIAKSSANVEGSTSPSDTANVETSAATNIAQPSTGDAQGSSQINQIRPAPPPGPVPQAVGPPPNAKYPNRAVARFQARVPRINMVAEPNATAARVAGLGPGDVFYVGPAQGDYYPASTADGLTGWLHVDLVTIVQGDAD